MTDSETTSGTLFGHRIGLFVLAGTEAWEYFSYYALRTLLVLFLTKQLGYSAESASSIYGIFSSLSYATPLLGGFLSDRYLGRQRTVILGSILMACGHFGLAFHAPLWPAMAAIIMGSGIFLPVLPAAVNDMYATSDPRRERAFFVYVISVNVGALLSPLICGALGERFGWNYGFAAAGVGMLLGLAIFVGGARHLSPDNSRLRAPAPRPQNSRVSFRWSRIPPVVWLIATLMLGMILLRGAYEQTGNTVALFAADHVDRNAALFGRHQVIPATWFQSLNPLMVLTLGPSLLFVWTRWERRGLILSEASKMVVGSVIIGLAYSALAGAAALAGPGKTAWPMLACFFVLLTFGELWVLPTALALVTRLAPAGYVSVVVAVWLTNRAVAGLLSGYLGRFMPTLGAPWFFLLCALFAFLSGAIFLILKQKMHRQA